jgi:tRNA-specific adenosine deaminase 3
VGTSSEPTCADPQPVEDGWAGLSTVAGETPNHVPEETPDPNEILPDDDLPFTWVKLTSDEGDEETIETVRTGEHVPRFPTRLLMPNTKVEAWAVDIPDPRHTTTALKYIYHYPQSTYSPTPCTDDRSYPFRWLKSSGLDTPNLSHLKRVRKSCSGTYSTLLLTSTSPTPPELPPELDLAPPYQLTVPRSAALTPTSLALKNALWPTVFAPRRKGEPEDWTRGRAHWACTAMMRVVEEALVARAAGEVRTPPTLCCYTFCQTQPWVGVCIFIASHRILRSRSAGGTHVGVLPRARYARLFHAPSATRGAQRRARAPRFDQRGCLLLLISIPVSVGVLAG